MWCDNNTRNCGIIKWAIYFCDELLLIAKTLSKCAEIHYLYINCSVSIYLFLFVLNPGIHLKIESPNCSCVVQPHGYCWGLRSGPHVNCNWPPPGTSAYLRPCRRPAWSHLSVGVHTSPGVISGAGREAETGERVGNMMTSWRVAHLWRFLRKIHWSPLASPHKGPVLRASDVFFVELN